MRKCLLFVALLIVSQLSIALAQDIFEAPDTVCIRQPINLKSLRNDATRHYWGFCSGYLMTAPTGNNLGPNFGLDGPNDIDIIKDGNNYYGFIISSITHEFKRLNFGTSLENTPTVTNYGNFDNALPEQLNSLFIVKDPAYNRWHIFVTGGNTVTNSSMARIDYQDSINTVPNIANFGNVDNVLNGPHGLFVAKEGAKWYGYLLNKTINSMVRVDFDTNISLTPALTDLGPSAYLNSPHDMVAVRDNGLWYFFVTNETNNSMTRFNVGNSIDISAMPAAAPIPSDKFFNPNGISFIRDCDSIFLFVTQRATNELVRVNMSDIEGPYTFTNFGNVAGIETPSNLSRMIRFRDNLYMFATNWADASFSRIKFEQCTSSTISSASTNPPPAYSYTTPGSYNVYYAINEGDADMQVQCKIINALPIPAMFISNDTVICQGDSIELIALSLTALNVSWSPNYNISSTTDITVKVSPEYRTDYRITLPYSNGCIVDTGIEVFVHKIKADAGPDRMISDGATTLVGGPNTTIGATYAYNWKPAQYVENALVPNTSVNPPNSFTYYLEVSDMHGCKDIDTVNISVECNDLNLPNAFIPESQTANGNARFGLLNRNIIRLNYFRIFDRWGREVFTTTDPLKQWDGRINGEVAPMGVYVWEADGFCQNNKRINKKGNVTLIR